MIDIDSLLTQTADVPPCGPNLEYDPAFRDLEAAVAGKPERQKGDTIIPAVPPDWNDVRQRATELLARTKDLRVAVPLSRALIRLDGIAGLRDGLRVIRELLECYWEQVHPHLDEDGDPTQRLNALIPLVDADTGLHDLRLAYLVDSRKVGQASVLQAEVALGRLPVPADGAAMTQEQLEGMIRVAAQEDLKPLEALRDASGNLRALGNVLAEKLGDSRGVDFRPLSGILDALVALCSRAVPQSPPTQGARGVEVSGKAEAGLAFSGEITSREDAVLLLDKVCDYLERHEPTNPAPLLIKRARRLMTMSFVEIVRDMVPESLAQVENIAGLKHD